jgi:type II secretory pathway predicted ATPase ExeA
MRYEASKAVPYRPFLGPTHSLALDALWQAVNDPSGLALLIGERGTGKTTLVNLLVQHRAEDFRIAYVGDCTESVDRIFEVMVQQLQIRPIRNDTSGRREAIKTFAADRVFEERVLLIFDEAQNLSDELLEDLGILTASRKAGLGLQIILVGESALARRLRDPKHRALNQMIGTRAELRNLGAEEVHDYVRYRMRPYASHPTWSLGALRWIAWLSAGMPRAIDRLCRECLLLAESEGVPLVMSRHVRAAAAQNDDLPQPGPNGPKDSLSFSEMMELSQHWVRRRGKTATIASLTAAIALGIAFVNIGAYSSYVQKASLGQIWSNLKPSKLSSDHESEGSRSRWYSTLGTWAREAARSSLDKFAQSRAFNAMEEWGSFQKGNRIDNEAGGAITRSSAATVGPVAAGGQSQHSKNDTMEKTSSKAAGTTYMPQNAPATEDVVGQSRIVRKATIKAPRRTLKIGPRTIPGIDSSTDIVIAEISQGDSLMRHGNYDIALLKYKAALVLDPDNARIKTRIKRAYRAKATENKILQ